jgi:hypothetical protein
MSEYFSDKLAAAIAKGWKLKLAPGKKTASMLRCPSCKKVRMVILVKKGKKQVKACSCGYKA